MSRLKLAALAAASTAALLSTNAHAADTAAPADATEVDKVTVTATRSEKPVSQVPATVTVFSASTLR